MATTERSAAEITSEERKVVFASSLGTVFEWYDFYLYATLAQFFAKYFFPKGNDTAALLAAFATYAAGFLVRPFGAIVFGRIGDLVGRKYTFLVTILVMGASTFLVGLLPSYESIGVLAPIALTVLRLLQGLALGGEYGGAATYVAEHSRPGRRGYATSWIQTTATLGFLLSLIVIGASRGLLGEATFDDIDDLLGDVLGVVTDAFDGAGDPDDVDGRRDGARIFHHVRDQLADDRLEFGIDIGVGLDDVGCLRRVETGEGIERLADHGQCRFGQVADADAVLAGQVAVLVDAADALGDLLGFVTNELS